MTESYAPLTAWSKRRFRKTIHNKGGELLFGRMFEDSALEMSLFPPGGRVFCIASAGCTTLDLASTGRIVDAVDINPAQTLYLSQRLTGQPIRQGRADRMLHKAKTLFHHLLPLDFDLRSFLNRTDTNEQVRIWQQVDSGWRSGLVNALFSHDWLRFFYQQSFLNSVPPKFGTLLRKRLLRTFNAHPNLYNIYLQMLLLHDPPPYPTRAPITNLPRVCAGDAAEFLNAGPPERYDGFSLSNILDGANTQYAGKLRTALTRAAKPGAVLILRSFQEPRTDEESRFAMQDRSAIWGRIVVRRIFPARWR